MLVGWAPKYWVLVVGGRMFDVGPPLVDGLNILLKNIGFFLEGRIQIGMCFSVGPRLALGV